MLDNLKALVEVRHESTTDANGGLRQRVTLLREGRAANELLVLNHIERPQNAADMGATSVQNRATTSVAVKPDLSDFNASAQQDLRLADEARKENVHPPNRRTTV